MNAITVRCAELGLVWPSIKDVIAWFADHKRVKLDYASVYQSVTQHRATKGHHFSDASKPDANCGWKSVTISDDD